MNPFPGVTQTKFKLKSAAKATSKSAASKQPPSSLSSTGKPKAPSKPPVLAKPPPARAPSIEYADDPEVSVQSKHTLSASSHAAHKRRALVESPEPEQRSPTPPPAKKARSSSPSRSSTPPTPGTFSRETSPVQADEISLEEWLDIINLLDGKASKPTRVENHYEPVYQACRQMARKMSHFTRFERVLRTGIKYNKIALDKQPWAKSSKYDTAMEDRTMWEVIMNDFPGFATHIKHLHGHHDGVKLLSRFLTTTLSKTRSDDILRMEYNNNFLRACNIPNSKYKLSEKQHRGYRNTTMARRLIPPQWISEFDDDPHTMTQKLKDGVIAPLAADLPSYLWDLDMYTKQDTLAGLLYGDDVRRGYKLLYTGPESAIENYHKSGKGQPSIAQKYGITTVTIHSIVYVALLVRHAWSAQGTWRDIDGKFSYPAMERLLFSACLRNPQYMRKLIADYTHDVYGTTGAHPDINPEDDPESTFGHLMNGPNELDDAPGAYFHYVYGGGRDDEDDQARRRQTNAPDPEPRVEEEGPPRENVDDADALPDVPEPMAVISDDHPVATATD